MQEIYACPQLLVEAPSINNSDLKIFTKDTPFNFVVKQALKQLDNLGVLAEVA